MHFNKSIKNAFLFESESVTKCRGIKATQQQQKQLAALEIVLSPAL